MVTLYLDSTGNDLNVGLSIDDKFFKVSYPCFQRQSETMIPEIDKLLKENNLLPQNVNDIVVTHGPGSYTGLRIALTIAKVYAFVNKCNCYSLSSLNVLMEKDVPSICLMNARSSRSYIGVYHNNECLLEDRVYTNEEVLNYIKEHPSYRICGDTKYLNIEGYRADLLENMKTLKNDSNKISDIYLLKATYLKD